MCEGCQYNQNGECDPPTFYMGECPMDCGEIETVVEDTVE